MSSLLSTLIEFFVKLITVQVDPKDELDFLKQGVSGGVDGLRKSFLLPRRIIAKVCAKTAHHHSYHTLASICCWRKRTLFSVSAGTKRNICISRYTFILYATFQGHLCCGLIYLIFVFCLEVHN